MGTRYATVLVAGDVPDYGDSAPTDDGSQTEANRVKYATIQTDLGNPLEAAIKSMDAKLLTQTDEGPDTEAGNVTLTTADHNTVLECSGTIAVTLPNPSGNAGFQCTVKNAGSGVITVNVDGGGNIDGVASITLPAGQANKVYVNNAESAYFSVTGKGVGDGFASGVIMVFELTNAPTGWTKKTDAAYNDTAMRVVTGTPGTGGSVAFSTVFGITATDAHTLTAAQIPAHNHAYVGVNFNGTQGTSGSGVSGSQLSRTTSNNTGGGGSHSHDIDLQVKYRDVIFAEKD